jgi:farnesyl-diphosphate farnesyltransferase
MTLDYLLKKTARSLYLSAKVLPRKQRRTFACGYLICRAADTVADTSIVAPEKRFALIKNYITLIKTQDEGLLKEFKDALPSSSITNPDEKLLLDNIDLCIQEFNKLSAAHKYLVLNLAISICRAMAWDLSFFPPETSGLIKATPSEESTIRYCGDMGGKPGVFWAKLLRNNIEKDTYTFYARRIGSALQITNILRDLAKDVKIGRCYLPFTDLITHGLMPQDLLDKRSYKKLKPVVFKWINWGVDNLMVSPRFLAKIPRYRFGARASVAWPMLWALDTLALLAEAKNLLDKNNTIKITRKTIYITMLLSPLYCFSNTAFKLIIRYKALKIKKIVDPTWQKK